MIMELSMQIYEKCQLLSDPRVQLGWKKNIWAGIMCRVYRNFNSGKRWTLYTKKGLKVRGGYLTPLNVIPQCTHSKKERCLLRLVQRKASTAITKMLSLQCYILEMTKDNGALRHSHCSQCMAYQEFLLICLLIKLVASSSGSWLSQCPTYFSSRKSL